MFFLCFFCACVSLSRGRSFFLSVNWTGPISGEGPDSLCGGEASYGTLLSWVLVTIVQAVVGKRFYRNAYKVCIFTLRFAAYRGHPLCISRNVSTPVCCCRLAVWVRPYGFNCDDTVCAKRESGVRNAT